MSTLGVRALEHASSVACAFFAARLEGASVALQSISIGV